MARIGIDMRMASGGAGISRYVTELFSSVLSQDRENEYVLFFRNQASADEFEKYCNTVAYASRKKGVPGASGDGASGEAEPVTMANYKIVLADIPHYSAAEQLRLPKILKQEHLDLMHFPHFNVPLFYNEPFVVTIHDLTHTRFPGRKKSHFLHRLAYNLVLKHAVSKSRRIIAVSQSTKNEVLDYFRISDKKITVVYEGAAGNYGMMDKEQAVAEVSNRFGVQKPYILYVGVWRRYKNLPALARAFDRLIDEGLDLELVIAGEEDPFYPEIREQIFAAKHKDRIRAVGRVSDKDLNFLYNGTALFVLPSLYEGFGLTTLEAAACGVPIACSDIPTLREVLGAGAEYFDPENLDNMTDVLKKVLEDPKRSEELANLALNRVRHFSWKQAGAETINVYGETLK